MSAPKFSSQGNSFYGELRSRINEYFQEAGKPSTGNYKLYFKAVVLVLSWVGFYIHLVFFTPGTWLALTESVIMGGLTAAIGFNVMHDGSHGSFSRKEWVNKLAGLSLNFLGANVFMCVTEKFIAISISMVGSLTRCFTCIGYSLQTTRSTLPRK